MGSIHPITNTAAGRRARISIGARFNITGLAILGAWLGVTEIWSDPVRMNSPGFRVAEQIMPMRWHGVVFLALGAWVFTAYITGRLLIPALLMYGGYFAFWAVLFVLSGFASPQSALTGVGPYGFIAWSAFASAQTITRVLVTLTGELPRGRKQS